MKGVSWALIASVLYTFWWWFLFPKWLMEKTKQRVVQWKTETGYNSGEDT